MADALTRVNDELSRYEQCYKFCLDEDDVPQMRALVAVVEAAKARVDAVHAFQHRKEFDGQTESLMHRMVETADALEACVRSAITDTTGGR